jgi:hypothetical protein
LSGNKHNVVKINFSICLLFIFRTAFCQEPVFKDESYYAREINKNIFRSTLTASPLSEITAALSYEHEIRKPFTIVLKTGVSAFTDSESEDSGIELSGGASGEMRYYFNLRHRTKHDKVTRNFSAGYFSLEPFVRSNALVFFSDSSHEARPAITGVYLNIGFQRQIKRKYIGAFMGIWFGRKPSYVSNVFDIIRLGVVIGHVF